MAFLELKFFESIVPFSFSNATSASPDVELYLQEQRFLIDLEIKCRRV